MPTFSLWVYACVERVGSYLHRAYVEPGIRFFELRKSLEVLDPPRNVSTTILAPQERTQTKLCPQRVVRVLLGVTVTAHITRPDVVALKNQTRSYCSHDHLLQHSLELPSGVR